MVVQDLSSFTCIPAASFDLTTLTGSFAPMNGTGFGSDIKILKIYNGSAVGVDISFDGVTKHTNNSSYGSGTLNGRAGQVIYGRTSTTATQLQMAGYR
jgi:hypothetical protein